MTLSIITINRNNLSGLRATLESVRCQTCADFEHILIDGASTDGSAEAVAEYAAGAPYPVRWISEPDTGIYNAMNKGIRISGGEYVEILNSGDTLASPDVVQRMLAALHETGRPDILYGNMIKCWPDGKRRRDRCSSGNITMYDMYHGTLNHNPAYIRSSLFDRFGMYDEQLKICSDWKWYLQAIVSGGVKPVYVDIDVTHFDMTGVSERGGESREIIRLERRAELERFLPAAILADYDRHADDIDLVRRLRRHPWAWRCVRLLERVLFKFEKWKRNSDSVS